jgi:hypothetical protein
MVLIGQPAHRFWHLWTAPEPWGAVAAQRIISRCRELLIQMKLVWMGRILSLSDKVYRCQENNLENLGCRRTAR